MSRLVKSLTDLNLIEKGADACCLVKGVRMFRSHRLFRGCNHGQGGFIARIC